MTACVLDTEASGLDMPHAAEIAYMDINSPLEFKSVICQRFNPLKPMSLGAMAVTGICDEDLQDCPPHTDFKLPADTVYLIGHNIDFDCQVLTNAGADLTNVKTICTLAIAKDIYPELDSYTLLALLYHIDKPYAKEMATKAHNAAFDVLFAAKLYFELYRQAIKKYGEKVASIERMYDFSQYARIPKKMPFGKHKGVAMHELPKEYVKWAVNNLQDIDIYLKTALTNQLQGV